MRKWLIGIGGMFCWGIFLAARVLAVDYEINNFDSRIILEEDSSLTITERIETNFLVAKHGIFRVIPYIYSSKGKTIKAELKIISVNNDKGEKIPYTVENYNQSKKIKIGSAETTVKGINEYIIKYKASEVVLDYGKGPEIYWNVTGSEWEVPIKKVKATVESPFGKIIQTECFGCKSNFSDSEAVFEGQKGLTIVVQIDKNNSLKMPSVWEKTINNVVDNWGYGIALIPFMAMLLAWYFKGRDRRYLSENVFYKEEKERMVGVGERSHLPLVYQGIKGLTPSEVGFIVDEKADLRDIVAEILELGRLGYLIIEKIETKKFLGKKTDYKLISKGKDYSQLKKHQKYLLESIFSSKIKKSININGVESSTEEIGEGEEIKISELKDNFYKHLEPLKEKIYKSMVEEGAIKESPEKTIKRWIGIATILNIIAITITVFWINTTGNPGPIFVSIGAVIGTYVVAKYMPYKNAWGYSLHRQAEGLKYYISKGKWREEIAEKKLFLAETLPLAVALGVVEKIAKEMEALGIEAPEYFRGSDINSFSRDLIYFRGNLSRNLVYMAAPSSNGTFSPSGHSSWSGGSGFSGGGHSGGGFGGGGGGSW